MFPGMNPKAVKSAMKKMGIQQEEIPAEEVLIKQQNKTLIIRNPEIVKINMMGQVSLQISGEIEELEKKISESDIKIVAEQAQVSIEEARKALEENKGNLAEAILKLSKS
ncbi:MAG TPA: nascent polypeptide-associated complex protein [Candidatus Nanoarchaeia archaeon]|nr:nascent polypeptide-associated complex protein [Candidatus Nanoarchaeia archaeon]